MYFSRSQEEGITGGVPGRDVREGYRGAGQCCSSACLSLPSRPLLPPLQFPLFFSPFFPSLPSSQFFSYFLCLVLFSPFLPSLLPSLLFLFIVIYGFYMEHVHIIAYIKWRKFKSTGNSLALQRATRLPFDEGDVRQYRPCIGFLSPGPHWGW